MDRKTYLDMLTFRKKNRITQQEVGDFLNASKSFISIVEKGRCNLPQDKLVKLYFDNEWDVTDLIPHFERVKKAWIEFNKINGVEGQIYPLDDQDPFGLGPNIIACLFYGEIGIDDKIANAICETMPSINREWLLQGTGEMFSSHSIALEERIALLENKLKDLEEVINQMKEVLKK